MHLRATNSHNLNMSESTEPARISFSKDKVGNFQKGTTGITGTSKKAIEPSEQVDVESYEPGNISYSGSELLFRNLDALGKKLNFTPQEQDTEEDCVDTETQQENHESNWSDDLLENLSEEEVIKNLNQHLGYRPATVDLALRFDENGNQLPQRVIESERKIKYEMASEQYVSIPKLIGKHMTWEPSYPLTTPSQAPFDSTPPPVKDTFCRSCGSKYLATDNFCGGCGNKRI